MAPRLDLAVIGSTGLRQYGGMLFEEFLPRLQGRRGALAYREMRDNSSTVGAIAFTIESLLRQVEWRVEPAGDSPEAKEWAEFVEGCYGDMSSTWEDVLGETLSMLTYGWSYLELVMKLRRGPDNANPKYRSKFDDGRVGWRKMPPRAQDTLDRWELQEDDSGVKGMWQMDMYRRGSAAVFIPIEKALLFRFGAHKGSPEGKSLYRNAILDWWRLKRIQDIEAIGIERDMTGLIHMQVPAELLSPSATAEQVAMRTELEKMLAGLKRDEREFAMVPSEKVVGQDGTEQSSGFKLSLLATGGRRQIDTDGIVKRYMNSITMSALADFLMLGTASVGSWALSSDKTRLFAMAMGATLDSICAVHNRYAIPRLMRMNGVPSKFWPELHHGDIETPPLDEVGKYITSLSMAGVLHPDEPLKRKLREIGKLPPPEEDMPLPGEEGLVPGEQPAPQETPGEPGGPPAGAAREGAQPPPGPPPRPAAPPDDDDEDDVEPGA